MDPLACTQGVFPSAFRQLLPAFSSIKHNAGYRDPLVWALIALVASFASPPASAQTTTFNYSGAVQTYTVPAGAAGVVIQAAGAGGGGGGSDEDGPGASGGSGAT